jgi:hypothetical protein
MSSTCGRTSWVSTRRTGSWRASSTWRASRRIPATRPPGRAWGASAG